MADYKYVLGIDLGTTNTLAYYMENGKLNPVQFKNKQMLPSVLYVDKNGKQYVGVQALTRSTHDSLHRVQSSKKFIGNNEINKTYDLYGKIYTPTDVATEILKEVRRRFIMQMEMDDDEKIGAVITVPAYFNNNQVSETRKAGFRAGFDVISIEPEPMMAAVAAARRTGGTGKVLVVDIGGGTFDLSVLEANEEEHTYEAIDIDGDAERGGDDFDDALLAHFIRIVEDQTGLKLSGAKEGAGEEYDELFSTLKQRARSTKEKLSEAEEVTVDEPDLLPKSRPDYDFKAVITRELFDDLCQETYDDIFSRMERFIYHNKKIRPEEITKLVLAGGSCYIPYVRERVRKMFPNLTDEAGSERSMLVAKGAALMAASKGHGIGEGHDITIRSIVAHSLGVMISEEGSKERVLEKILPQGTRYGKGIICQKSKEFTTTRDNQTEIPVLVYEAGSDVEDERGIGFHKFYGSLTLKGIEPLPKKQAIIEVTFSYNENQILTVTAVDKKTGRSEEVKLKEGERPPMPESVPVDLALLIDKSGSMRGSELIEAKKASHKLVDEMLDLSVHRVGLIAFNDDAEVRSSLTHNENGELAYAIDGIEAKHGTNMIAAFSAAEQMLNGSGSRDRVVIMVTDGYPNTRPKTISMAQRLVSGGIKVYAIGVGSGIDLEFLQEMAGRENAFVLDSMEKLAKKFEEIVELITTR